MITSIEIERLRGIESGKLEGLTPLTVLVGPNGSGKSTVLDALLIGASPVIGDAIGRAVRRRSSQTNGLPWLVHRRGSAGAACIRLHTDVVDYRVCTLSVTPTSVPQESRINWATEQFNHALGQPMQHEGAVRWKWDTDRAEYVYDGGDLTARHVAEGLDARLVNCELERDQPPLHDLFSRARQEGRKEAALAALSSLVPGLEQVEILTDEGRPGLSLSFPDRAVPAEVAGDGIRSLLRTCLECAARPRGLVLIEEPEVHQHPAAIRQTARVLLETVKRGVQVVATTHSIELIDFLLDACGEADLPLLLVIRVVLRDGRLLSSAWSGGDAAALRRDIYEDLR